MKGSMKKIAIVDDHEFFRSGLKLALKRNKTYELAFDAPNGADFLEKMKSDPVDLVLLDLKMPIMDGYETSLRLKELYPDVKIIILSMFDNSEYVQKLIEAGVNGFILKNIGKQELDTALNHVFNGRHYFSSELMTFLPIS